MSEKIMKIADFAELIGCTSKTIYALIDKEELITGKDRLNGREITVIISNDEQIADLQKRYSKLLVNEVDYEDILTVNEGNKQVNNLQNHQQQENLTTVIERLITSNEQVNNQLITVYEELSTEKSKTLLLEDKANREGLYLNEINELKTDNKGLLTINKWSLIALAIISTLLIVAIGMLIYNFNNPKIIEKEVIVEKIVPAPQKKK